MSEPLPWFFLCDGTAVARSGGDIYLVKRENSCWVSYCFDRDDKQVRLGESKWALSFDNKFEAQQACDQHAGLALALIV